MANTENKTTEIGRVKLSETIDIVVSESIFRGKKGIDIRQFATTKNYTGFTQRGIRIPLELWNDVKLVLDKIKI